MPHVKRKPQRSAKAKRRSPAKPRRAAARKPKLRARRIAGDPPRDINGYDPVATAGDCVFDRAAAERVIRFVELLCVHVKGPLAGKPIVLQDWERDIYLTLFGWKRPDGTRRYRKAFITMARKNSKTTTFDGPIALWMTGYDGEYSAENYVVSSKKDQAAICWGIAADMVRLSKPLGEVFEVMPSTKRVLHYATGSFFAALPADASGAHGMNPYLVINDETHVTSAAVLSAIETGFGARNNQLELFTTTAGDDKATEWWRLLEYARKIVAGSQASERDRRREAKYVDDAGFLPVLFECPEDEQLEKSKLKWTDPAAWKLANPNLGVSIRQSQLEAECKEAQDNLLKEADFRRLRLNQFVERQQKPIKREQWQACFVDPKLWPQLDGRECYGGVDCASSRDLAAKALVFPIDGKVWVKVSCYWPPQSARDSEKEIKAPLTRWIDDGFLITSPDQPHYTDHHLVARDLQADHGRYKLLECGFDKYDATQLANDCDAFGIKMVEVPQTCLGMNEATKWFIKAVGEQRICHDGHPVVTWCIDNLEVITDRNGRVRPAKPLLPGSERTEDRSKKIDAAVAIITAIARLIVPEPVDTSIYNTRDVIVI